MVGRTANRAQEYFGPLIGPNSNDGTKVLFSLLRLDCHNRTSQQDFQCHSMD